MVKRIHKIYHFHHEHNVCPRDSMCQNFIPFQGPPKFWLCWVLQMSYVPILDLKQCLPYLPGHERSHRWQGCRLFWASCQPLLVRPRTPEPSGLLSERHPLLNGWSIKFKPSVAKYARLQFYSKCQSAFQFGCIHVHPGVCTGELPLVSTAALCPSGACNGICGLSFHFPS